VSFFFFSSRRRHTRFSRDWSSDVCSSDLDRTARVGAKQGQTRDPADRQRPLGGREDEARAAGADRGGGGRRIAGVEGPREQLLRSEERRVGKEGRCAWSPEHVERMRTGRV